MDPNILYVMGDGRSGSTLLGILLGNHPSIECVGELRRWLEFNGSPKPGNEKQSDHSFWEAVKTIYSQEDSLMDMPTMLKAQLYVESYARFPVVVFGLIPSNLKNVYQTHLRRLFGAIGAVSRKSVILDISKNMGRAATLFHIAKGRIKVIHLVRDPRAVLWSQLKQNIEQDYKSPLKSMLHYSIKNSLCHLVKWFAPAGTVLQVRYEDLANNPLDEIRRIGAFVDLPMGDLAERVANGGPLTVGHLIDGNRIRNESSIRLKPDREWQLNLKKPHRFLAVLITLPFYLQYGYYRSKQLKKKEVGA